MARRWRVHHSGDLYCGMVVSALTTIPVKQFSVVTRTGVAAIFLTTIWADEHIGKWVLLTLFQPIPGVSFYQFLRSLPFLPGNDGRQNILNIILW